MTSRLSRKTLRHSGLFSLVVGCLTLFAVPTAHSAPAKKAVSAQDGCSYPAITIVDLDRTRNIAQTAFEAYEVHLQDAHGDAACVQAFRAFLSDVARAQQVAGAMNRASREAFQQKEMTVRLKLFEELNVDPLSSAAIAIYKINIQRLYDLYWIRKHAKRFLDDIVSSDVHFAAIGSRLVRVKEGVRSAIYSCGNWDFRHAENAAYMYPQWKEQKCATEFETMSTSIQRFAEIAPAAVAYLRTTQTLPATPATAESPPKEGVQ
jgi:hypothetical protein